MAIIWLEYVQDTETDAKKFDALSVYPRKLKGGTLEEGLRGGLFRHVTSRRYLYDILISADELYIESNIDFLNAFWFAKEQRVSFDDTTGDTKPDIGTFIKVDSGDGQAPEEFLEDDKWFPEWNLSLQEMQPRTWNGTEKKWEPVYLS